MNKISILTNEELEYLVKQLPLWRVPIKFGEHTYYQSDYHLIIGEQINRGSHE